MSYRVNTDNLVRGGSNPIPERVAYLPVQAEQVSPTLTTTDQICHIWDKTIVRNLQAVIRYHCDGWTSPACTLTHRFYLGNAAARVMPMVVGWDMVPTGLNAVTDENITTETNNWNVTGSTKAATYVQLDLGQLYNGWLFLYRLFGSTGFSSYLDYQVSTNGTTWYSIGTETATGAAAWAYWYSNTQATNVRYIRISCWGDGGIEAVLALRELAFFTRCKKENLVLGYPPQAYGLVIDGHNMVVATASVDAATTGTPVMRYQLQSSVDLVR